MNPLIIPALVVGAFTAWAYRPGAYAAKPAPRVQRRPQYIQRPPGLSDAAWEAVREGEGHGAAREGTARLGGPGKAIYRARGRAAFFELQRRRTSLLPAAPYVSTKPRGGWQYRAWVDGYNEAYWSAQKPQPRSYRY